MTPDGIRAWLAALGGQRFLLTVGAGIVNTILVWNGKITSGDFVLVTGATVAVFIGAAAYQQKGQNDARP
jgi:hypothetical protein